MLWESNLGLRHGVRECASGEFPNLWIMANCDQSIAVEDLILVSRGIRQNDIQLVTHLLQRENRKDFIRADVFNRMVQYRRREMALLFIRNGVLDTQPIAFASHVLVSTLMNLPFEDVTRAILDHIGTHPHSVSIWGDNSFSRVPMLSFVKILPQYTNNPAAIAKALIEFGANPSEIVGTYSLETGNVQDFDILSKICYSNKDTVDSNDTGFRELAKVFIDAGCNPKLEHLPPSQGKIVGDLLHERGVSQSLPLWVCLLSSGKVSSSISSISRNPLFTRNVLRYVHLFTLPGLKLGFLRSQASK